MVGAPVDVSIKAKVAIRRVPKRCKRSGVVTGVVRPRHAGTKVILQKRVRKDDRKRWKKVDVDRLGKRSRFKVEVPSCRGRYRVVWRSQDERNARGATRFRLRR